MSLVDLSVELLVELGGWSALKEARGLVERGKVTDVLREGATIRARVQGPEKLYDPRIVLAERISQVEVHCTCAESRKSGCVCAHALAAGWAVLHPPARAVSAQTSATAPIVRAAGPVPRYFLQEEAPVGTPAIECTILLPLQLKDALKQPTLRVILEARTESAEHAAPWDTVVRNLPRGFAVSEEDAGLLDALEEFTGAVTGISFIPASQAGAFLRRLSGHPRVWLGKKQRIEVRGAKGRPFISVRHREDGAIELLAKNEESLATSELALPLPGWAFDGKLLVENSVLPKGFLGLARLIAREKIPQFLAEEWPELERTCELAFAPGFGEFIFETGRPSFEAHLEGTLSGLTLSVLACYGAEKFPVDAISESRSEGYFPDSASPNRFWCRNLPAEKAAFARIDEAGFKHVRSGATGLSLISENKVARFLANSLPRWRRDWTVILGSRLQSVMEQIDIAQPEFSLRGGSGEDWLGLDLKLSVGGKPVRLSPSEIQRWLQTGQNHTRTADKRVLLVPTEAWSEMREVLADCAVEQEPGRMRVPRTYAPFLSGALVAQGFSKEGVAEAPLPPLDLESRLDQTLLAQLRPYQRTGIEWLSGLARQKFSALLADDMGLGKTIQALAFCAWLRSDAAQGGPVLVVCPTSLVANWLREAARFVPHLRALDLTGAGRAEKMKQAGKADLLVTSYAILRRDVESYRGLDFSLVILDEAQHIKNRGSQNAQAAKALRSRQRLILTGTPLENSILDLWSLFDFLLPGYLGTAADFHERYETPLTRGIDARAMERLRHRVRPFFLRRTKAEVLPELPPKLEFPTLCELSDEQREVYRAILAQGRRDVFERSGKAGQGRDRIAVLTTLLRLRQVCCHLDLLPAGEEKREWKEPSAKLERTFELIDEAIDGGHRVLLFSQFVRALHLLRDEARRRGLRFAYLDGQTIERQAEVDRFQNDAGIPLFFISLKAGGTGLNLTGADTVIHFDPWWNPAVEEQATARAHRLGQARRVQAYKLIAAGTVEEKIQAMQARKRDLFQASVGGDNAFVESLTGDELEDLLTE